MIETEIGVPGHEKWGRRRPADQEENGPNCANTGGCKKKSRLIRVGVLCNGGPDKIRTCDREIRNLELYPAELRDLSILILTDST